MNEMFKFFTDIFFSAIWCYSHANRVQESGIEDMYVSSMECFII